MNVSRGRANLEDFRTVQWKRPVQWERPWNSSVLRWLTAGVEAVYEENVRRLPFLTRLLPCLTVLASLERVVLQVELPCATGYRLKPSF